MALVMGENALCYIGAVPVPSANEWSISIEQEKIEAPKVFVCPPSASSSWVSKTGGYYSASGSISCVYDAADTNHLDYVLEDAEYVILLYPDCVASTKYWMGSGWVQVSMSTPVDGYVTADFDWESTGAWDWKST
jgi:hypothetical protein